MAPRARLPYDVLVWAVLKVIRTGAQPKSRARTYLKNAYALGVKIYSTILASPTAFARSLGLRNIDHLRDIHANT